MKTILKVLDIFEEGVSMLGFFLMFAVVTINVFSRYVLGRSFSWAEEVSYICFAWSVFMGVCILYKKQGLICIDILVNHMPEKIQKIVRIATFALISITNAMLVFYGFSLANGAWIRKSASLQVPYFFIDMAPTTAFTILLFYSIRFLILSVKGEEIDEKSLEERS